MKKAFIAALLVLVVVVLAGCPDAAGLHNQPAATITIKFVSFPTPNGDYAIPGNYNGPDWAGTNATTRVTISDGTGTSGPITMGSDTIDFTLTPTGSWDRGWYPATIGNLEDGGGPLKNFRVSDLPLGGSGTITINGSTKPATISVSW